jgi:hypothetical protein
MSDLTQLTDNEIEALLKLKTNEYEREYGRLTAVYQARIADAHKVYGYETQPLQAERERRRAAKTDHRVA